MIAAATTCLQGMHILRCSEQHVKVGAWQVGLLVASKGELGPLLHVCDPDQLLACWRRCRPDGWHNHLFIALEGPATFMCSIAMQ